MTKIDIEISKEKPAIAGALVAQHLADKEECVSWKVGNSNMVVAEGGNAVSSSASLGRFLARSFPAHGLYGCDILQKTEIDHWLNFAYRKLACTTNYNNAVNSLDQLLQPATFIVGGKLTLADFSLWEVLHTSCQWQTDVAGKVAPQNVLRYYSFLSSQKPFAELKDTFQPAAAKEVKKRTNEVSIKKDEGKFVELPGAAIGNVVVRFPPEASGYLHVGHAKAALLNQHYRDTFKGKLIMRFDDTNPAKEDAEFEKIILEDLKLLGVSYDMFSHTSDHFDSLLKYCEKMIGMGKAYVDDTAPEAMKKEREERVESKHRSNDAKTNMKMWEEMKKGTAKGQTCAVRAKLDMKSDNGCMRDPTIYRCKNEPHVRTGHKYKVYPTYDFACPIVDSVEGVTHALRTTEYHDRDDQYFWFIDALGLRKPYIYEYSRLNLQNTVMSKRKLTWIVNEGYVDGWDDPRFPTVRGVLRRGMTVEGLRQFIITQGSSRSVNMMEWDKIWSYNKKVIDPVVPRYTALSKEGLIELTVTGAALESKEVAKHPKNEEVGTKTIWYGPKIYVEGADAEVIKEGETVTFINWGNLKISKVNKNKDGKVESLAAELDLQNTDYKKTQKITWLTNDSQCPCTPTVCVFYDHIISKGVLAKDEDFKQFLNTDSKKEEIMMGDPCLASLKKGDVIQLQRRGYFICDQPYEPVSPHTGVDSPCILFYIPDGHQKEMPKGGSKHKEQPKDVSAKEKAQSNKGKAAEKSPQVEESPSIGSGSVDVQALNQKIVSAGDSVRKLKADKAAKQAIEEEVKKLLSLKAEFKTATGKDWKPGMTIPGAASPPAVPSSSSSTTSAELNDKVAAQGNKVRDLKAQKADKKVIEEAVKNLLALKAEFKSATGKDWKPGMVMPTVAAASPEPSSPSSTTSADLNDKVAAQGNKVRDLKAQKADKKAIEVEVKTLLALKAEFKSATGKDWKPGMVMPTVAAASPEPSSASSSDAELNDKVAAQGNKVRDLKAQKADKKTIEAEVKKLLDLKADFKSATGKDWKPGMTFATDTSSASSSSGTAELDTKISAQGNKVRDLKAQKADKSAIDAGVKELLALKAEYKALAGKDWKPSATSAAAPAAQQGNASKDGDAMSKELAQSVEKLRSLKSSNADKSQINTEEKKLNTLKKEYKKVTGCDWKEKTPEAAVAMPPTAESPETVALKAKIDEQGDVVRKLKSSGGDKAAVDAAVKKLLGLKEDYKTLTGQNVAGAGGRGDKKEKKGGNKGAAASKENKQSVGDGAKDDGKREVKKITRLGLEATKEDNLPEWYSQVIIKSEMIEYYDVSGCYILRPWAFSIWELIKDHFDKVIRKSGVENCSFPMFISKSALEREKDHIEDFAPEVAWVTRSGQSELAEPIAIRPTSETVMYPSYAKWIKSHRDLPLRLNQWCNVVRWEFKHPQPFLRTREFLWQEGHTAWADAESAEAEVHEMVEEYALIYEDLLAIPVVRGRKTEKEKFAGGDFTTTVEAYISASGRAIQGATSHHLGQNFSKMFEIVFEDPETKQKRYVYQNSWGITTRTIGVLAMVHGDNTGLVLPPKIASLQAVIIPCGITVNMSEKESNNLYAKCKELSDLLVDSGLRVKADNRPNYSPGWKFNHWELKGVPLRVELGPRDLSKNQVMSVRRDNGNKQTLSMDGIVATIKQMLEGIQKDLFAKAKKELDDNLVVTHDWDVFCTSLDVKKLIQAPFCGEIPCEDKIKKDSARDAVVEEGAPAMGAKGLCIPFQQPKTLTPGTKCIGPGCGKEAKYYTMFGRSY